MIDITASRHLKHDTNTAKSKLTQSRQRGVEAAEVISCQNETQCFSMSTHWLHWTSKQPHVSLSYQTLHISGFRRTRCSIRFKFLYSDPVGPKTVTQVLYSRRLHQWACIVSQIFSQHKILNDKDKSSWNMAAETKKRKGLEGSKAWRRCVGWIPKRQKIQGTHLDISKNLYLNFMEKTQNSSGLQPTHFSLSIHLGGGGCKDF